MATECVQEAGYTATCLDIEDHARYGLHAGVGTVFDILSPSGFPSLGVL